jgi:hypothetical protein
LPPRERELLILRIGWLNQAEYEWAQHVEIAKRSGISTEEIERIKRGPGAGWSALEDALIRAVDELYENSVVSDQTWATLAENLSVQQLMDVVFTVGQYNLVSWALNSFGVPLDDFLGLRGCVTSRSEPLFRDGPLSRRPPEQIRYGTGKCALGRVLVALSDKGIVSIMIREQVSQLAARSQDALSEGRAGAGRGWLRSGGGQGRPVHRGAGRSFPASARHSRHRTAEACLERSAQDSARRQFDVHEDRRGHRLSESDPRCGEFVLAQLAGVRRALPPRPA